MKREDNGMGDEDEDAFALDFGVVEKKARMGDSLG